MPDIQALVVVMEGARRLLDNPDNDFAWSWWNDREEALAGIDGVLAGLRRGEVPPDIAVLFAPTGPIQEVSISSGWGSLFLELASRFDDAISSDTASDHPTASCTCLDAPLGYQATVRELGMDSRFGEVSILHCPECGRDWLRYFYEVEAFGGSGRWYMGAITRDQLELLIPENAMEAIEQLDWYFFGGSYFEGRTGKSSGPIMLNP